MKNRLTLIVCTVAATAAIYYLTALLDVGINAVWLVLFAVVTSAACAAVRKAAVGPGSISLAIAAGLLLTHLPWWVAHHIAYEVSYGVLLGYFPGVTPLLFSLLGTAIGYLAYKAVRIFAKRGGNTETAK